MGGMIASAATAGCTFLCCGACNRCSEAKTGAISRIPYVFLFFASAVVAIVMSLYGEEEFGFKFYHTHVCQEDSCLGNGSVFRVSLCLFVFELIHVLLLTKAPAFHSAFFPFKCIGLIILLICSFVIEGLNPIFDEWAELARFFSALYLLIQLLLFVSWSYDLNEYLRVRGDQLFEYNERNGYSQKCCCECIPGNCYHWSLGLLSVGCLLFAFVALGLFYPLYDRNDQNAHCKIHESVTSITIILCGLTATASVVRGDGSFGVAAMICLYATFLLFNAMQADPDDAEEGQSCNLLHRQRGGLSLWIGFLLTLASLFYAAMRSDMMAILGKTPRFVVASDGSEDVEVDDADGKVKSLLTANDKQQAIVMEPKKERESNYDDVDEEDVHVDEDEDEEGGEDRGNLYFHVVLMLAAAYMAMLFTNWGTNKDKIDTTGTISFVVGTVSSWTTFLLFWWTLCAPRLCPHRFPQNEEE